MHTELAGTAAEIKRPAQLQVKKQFRTEKEMWICGSTPKQKVICNWYSQLEGKPFFFVM